MRLIQIMNSMLFTISEGKIFTANWVAAAKFCSSNMAGTGTFLDA
jgi:hypothetical protein